MPQLDSQAERIYPAGQAQSGNLQLPEGARELAVVLTTPSPDWPAVSDGTITVSLWVSRDNGPFEQEWSDTFQHKRVVRNGVPLTQLRMSAQLQFPFGATDRCRYEFNSPINFRSAVSIEANVVPTAG
jgi:hypothetical protein